MNSGRDVLRCLLKVFREVAERTVSGRLFHTRAAATPNVRSPAVRNRVRGTISLWVVDGRRRCRELLSELSHRKITELMKGLQNVLWTRKWIHCKLFPIVKSWRDRLHGWSFTAVVCFVFRYEDAAVTTAGLR